MAKPKKAKKEKKPKAGVDDEGNADEVERKGMIGKGEKGEVEGWRGSRTPEGGWGCLIPNCVGEKFLVSRSAHHSVLSYTFPLPSPPPPLLTPSPSPPPSSRRLRQPDKEGGRCLQ